MLKQRDNESVYIQKKKKEKEKKLKASLHSICTGMRLYIE
jgi:hypothetical protein